MPDSTVMIVVRDTFQYEYYNGITSKYKVTWLDECRYSLKLIKTDSDMMEGIKDTFL